MNQNSILVINCGSSSLKFSIINPISGDNLLSGLAERLMSPQASIKIKKSEETISESLSPPFDHQTALTTLVKALYRLDLVGNIIAIGHRVVHGGEYYSQPTLINVEVKSTIEQLAQLAPLHNPANLIGINAAQDAFPSLPQVAVFDTAFHQTMPEKAYLYGLPFNLYKQHGIRRYGFHGTSHYFVAQQAAKLLNKPLEQCNLISAHLGNGCSVTAIKNGQSVDTSLGFTPLEGVMMGTRSGDVDPGVIFHLVEQLGYSVEEVNQLLNKESGLLGVSQISNDCRALETAVNDDKNAQAELALTVFCYRIAKAIAGFSASLSSLDGLIFTGGIGENSLYVRKQILAQLSLLNFYVDDQQNEQIRFGKSGIISSANSRPCWVIPTNEEWVISQQTHQLISVESNEGTA